MHLATGILQRPQLMSRVKTPGHFIYNEYGIIKETQEPDKSVFVRIYYVEQTNIKAFNFGTDSMERVTFHHAFSADFKEKACLLSRIS